MFLEKSRARILREFEDFLRELPEAAEEISRKLEAVDEDVSLAMKYMYCHMPLSDVGNYPFETFLDFAVRGVKLWEDCPYVKEYPEEYFLNYVLFHRVNEEEIRPCRSLFGGLLEEITAGLDMETAILEINHWCAKEAMYQSTDARTSSALGVYECGYGRCGEESVFGVNALRSAGIPARQVYVPRWAHCDDNHAWVEVWCNGNWHYLGACEPEAALDRGWFTNAASRAMMVSSRWFDSSEPDGEVIGREGVTLMVNQLQRYAKTTRITIHVNDLDGMPVEGALVLAEVMNYAEFSPVAVMHTDKNGIARLTTGLGSLHLCAVFEGAYGEALIDTRDGAEFSCVLGEEFEENLWMDFDMTAPEDTAKEAAGVTRAQEEENRLRTAREAKMCSEKMEKFCPAWQTFDFGAEEDEVRELLTVLSEKDRRDVSPEVLLAHCRESRCLRGTMDEALFLQEVRNPRIEDEILTSWRNDIQTYFTEEEKEKFRENPGTIWAWIEENIAENNDRERSSVYTTPAAALRLKTAGARSRRILFAAIARTLGVPARLAAQDGAMEYWDGTCWQRVLRESKKDASIILTAQDGGNWNYYQNWTIARAGAQGYVTLALSEAVWDNGRLALEVEAGWYRVLTANRLPNGTIFAKSYRFFVDAGEACTVSLQLREIDFANMLNIHTIPDSYVKNDRGEVRMSSLTGGARRILCWLDVGKEPTEHILNEMMEHEQDYRALKENVIFFVRGAQALENATLKKCMECLPKAQVYFDEFGKDLEMTARRMYTNPEKLPLLLVTDGACRGMFAAAGYSVGMADMLLRIYRS